MKEIKLLPYNFKYAGAAIVVCGGAWNVFRTIKYHLFVDPYDPLIGAIIGIGFLLVIFSKQKCEDEFINQLRLRSFLATMLFTCIWAIIGNVCSFAAMPVMAAVISLKAVYIQAFYVLYFLFSIEKK